MSGDGILGGTPEVQQSTVGPLAGLAARPAAGERSLLADTAALAVGYYVGQAFVFIAGFVHKGVLGPEDTGYWTLLGVMWSLFGLASLGVFSAATREVPAERGRDDLNAAAEVADTAGTWSLASFTAIGAIAAVVALVAGEQWAPELRWGLVILGLTAPLRVLVDVHTTLLQAVHRFDAVSIALAVAGALTLTVQTALVLAFGYYGMWAGLVVTSLASLAIWARMGLTGLRKPAFRRRIAGHRLGRLIATGLPLLVYGQIELLFFGLDTFMVGGYLGPTELGLYAVAISVKSYVLMLPKVVTMTLLPRMQERFTREGTVGSAERLAVHVPRALAFAPLLALLTAVYFAIPVLVRHALPEFEASIGAVRLMVLGAFFLGLAPFPVQLMITTGRRWSATALMLACLGLNAVANVVALGPLNAGIEGAAVAASLSYACFWLVMTVAALRIPGVQTPSIQQIAILMGTFAAMVAVLVGVEAIAPAGGNLPVDAVIATTSILVSLLALSPFMVLAQRRYGLASAALGLLTRRRRP